MTYDLLLKKLIPILSDMKYKRAYWRGIAGGLKTIAYPSKMEQYKLLAKMKHKLLAEYAKRQRPGTRRPYEQAYMLIEQFLMSELSKCGFSPDSLYD